MQTAVNILLWSYFKLYCRTYILLYTGHSKDVVHTFQHFIFVKAPRSRIKLCIFDYRKLFTHKNIYFINEFCFTEQSVIFLQRRNVEEKFCNLVKCALLAHTIIFYIGRNWPSNEYFFNFPKDFLSKI